MTPQLSALGLFRDGRSVVCVGRRFRNSAGNVGVFAQVVAGADPVVPVGDLQRKAAIERPSDQQDGRELLAGSDFRQIGGDVLVVCREQRQAGGTKDVLGLEMI